MTTEAQMVRETLLSEQTLLTFIGLLTGLDDDDTRAALEELLSV